MKQPQYMSTYPVQQVDLLEGKPLRLRDAEVGEDSAAGTSRAPDEEDLHAESRIARARVHEVRCRVPNAEVPQPVAGGGHAHSLRTHGEREDLAGNDPRDRAPGRGEASDVDAHESDERLLARLVVDGDGDANDRDEELADAHEHGTPYEEGATAEALDAPHARYSHAHVDNVGSHCKDDTSVQHIYECNESAYPR
jgi:hypothetical protein